MDNISHFHSLEELIRALDRERKLIHALFQDRKKLSFRYELARELASKKDESIEFLHTLFYAHLLNCWLSGVLAWICICQCFCRCCR